MDMVSLTALMSTGERIGNSRIGKRISPIGVLKQIPAIRIPTAAIAQFDMARIINTFTHCPLRSNDKNKVKQGNMIIWVRVKIIQNEKSFAR